MALKFSMILEAVDRASGPLKSIRDAARGLSNGGGLGAVEAAGAGASSALDELRETATGAAGGGLDDLKDAGREAAKEMEDLRDAARGASGIDELGDAGRDAGRGLDDAADAADDLDDAARDLDRSTDRAERGLRRGGRAARFWGDMMEDAGTATGRLARKVGALALGAAKWGGLAVAGGATFGLKKVIELSSQFEQFQVILEKTEGSAAGAKTAMDWVKDFGTKTPYEISEVMEAFVKLRAYGIDPTKGTLESLGNASSGMGKDLMSAIEMMADAQTGEFERLKEFGIRASKAGDKVTFSYQKAGKEVTRTAKSSAAEIEKALTGIFDDRFGGMMNRQSKTMAGMWSNLKDLASGFLLDVGNSGFADKLKERLGGLLETVNQMAADGRLAAWADDISAKLSVMTEKAFDFVENTDWGKVADRIMAVASALAKVVTGITDVLTKTYEAGVTLRARLAGIREDNIFSTSEGRKEAKAERQQAERELGRPVTEAGRREQAAKQSGNWNAIRQRAAADRRRLGIRELPRGQQPAPRPRGQQPAPRRRVGLAPVPTAAQLNRLIKPQPVQVGGKVSIDVKASPELNARLSRLETMNRQVPIQVANSGWGRSALRGLSLWNPG